MRRLAITAFALAAALTLVAPSGQPASTAVKPFAYEFRLVDFTMTATLTYATSQATTRYRLEKPSKPLKMSYLGPKVSATAWRRTWTVAPAVTSSGRGTYKSPDPTCTRTIDTKVSRRRTTVFLGWNPPRGAKRISAAVGRIPLAEPHPGQDVGGEGALPDKCGKPVFGNWYQDVVAYAPIGLLATKPRVTVKGHPSERFTDPGIESIEWDITAVLQRIRYTPIDCAIDKGC